MRRREGDPINRKEDPLEVGLGRHDKRGSVIPPALVEYAGWIFVGIAILCLAVSFVMFRGGETRRSIESTVGGARLSVISSPAKIWAEGASTKLHSVRVAVVNNGAGVAEKVTVFAVIRGDRFQLTGPTLMAPGQRAAFLGEIGKIVASEEPITVETECATCQ